MKEVGTEKYNYTMIALFSFSKKKNKKIVELS